MIIITHKQLDELALSLGAHKIGIYTESGKNCIQHQKINTVAISRGKYGCSGAIIKCYQKETKTTDPYYYYVYIQSKSSDLFRFM